MALVLMLAAAAPPARGADDNPFRIRNAYTELRHGVFYLYADMKLDLREPALKALNSGVPLIFKIEIHISERGWLWDSDVAELTQAYRITYHALSQRYVVRSLNSSSKQSYRSWRAALRDLNQVNGIPVIDTSLLDNSSDYDISIHAALKVKIIPTGFGLITSFFYGADQASDWVEWSLE